MKHVSHMSLNSTISRQKYSRICGCQGVEEPISLIMRSWVSRKRANVAGTWGEAVKTHWSSQSYFLAMQFEFASQRKLPNSDWNLQKMDSTIVLQRMHAVTRKETGSRMVSWARSGRPHNAAHWSTATQGQWLVFGKTFRNHSHFYHFPRVSPAWTEDNSTVSSDDSLWDRWAVLQRIKALSSWKQMTCLCLGCGHWCSWCIARNRDVSMESKTTGYWP